MIRERIVRMHIDDQALNFPGTNEIEEFAGALGRMAGYGLRSGHNEGIEFVDISIGLDGTVTGNYYPAVQWQPGIPGANQPFFELNAALEKFSLGDPEVHAAVPETDGTYSYY